MYGYSALWASVVAISFTFACSVARAQDEREPNGTRAQATPTDAAEDLVLSDLFRATGSGATSSAADDDYFAVELDSSQRLWVRVDANVTLVVFGPDGTQLATSTGSSGLTVVSNAWARTAGTYTFRVRASRAQAYSYVALGYAGVFEQETAAQNNTVLYSESLRNLGFDSLEETFHTRTVGFLGDTDEDHLALYARAGETIRVAVGSSSLDPVTPRVTLLSDRGSMVALAVAVGSVQVVDYIAVSNGPLVVHVERGGDASGGLYLLEATVRGGYYSAEIEPNDTLDDATALRLRTDPNVPDLRYGNAVGEMTWTGGYPRYDDRYRFHAEAGDLVMLTAHWTWQIPIHWTGFEFSLQFYFFDPSGRSLFPTHLANAPHESPRIVAYPITETGDYVVRVDNSDSSTGIYELEVMVYSGERMELETQYVAGPNPPNDVTAAPEFEAAGSAPNLLGLIDEGDNDRYKLGFLREGQTVELALNIPEFSTLVPTVNVLDAVSSVELSVSDPVALASGFVFTAEAAGDYVVEVASSAGDSFWGYYELAQDVRSYLPEGVFYEEENEPRYFSRDTAVGSENVLGEGFSGVQIRGTLDSRDSRDYIRLPANAGDSLFVFIDLYGDLAVTANVEGRFGTDAGYPQANLFGHDWVISNIQVSDAVPFELQLFRSSGSGAYDATVVVGPSGLFTRRGRTFQRSTVAATFSEGVAEASDLAGHLATVDSEDINRWLTMAFTDRIEPYIGYADTDGTGGWSWSSPGSSLFNGFVDGDPAANGSRAAVLGHDGTWLAVSTDERRFAVIESERVSILAPVHQGTLVEGDTLWFRAAELEGASTILWDRNAEVLGDGQSLGLVSFVDLGESNVRARALDDGGDLVAAPSLRTLNVVADTGSFADLQLASGVPSRNYSVSQLIEVDYTVTNRGHGAISNGEWTDGLFLSADRYLDSADTLLAQAPQAHSIAVGNAYRATLRGRLPEVDPGDYYLLVATDTGWQMIQERRLNDVVALPVHMDIAVLTLGVPTAGDVQQAGDLEIYRFHVDEQQRIQLRFDDMDDSGCIEVRLSHESSCSSASESDIRAQLCAPDNTVLIEHPAPGDWYLCVYGTTAAGAYNVTVESADLLVSQLFPRRHAPEADVAFEISGAGFVDGMTVGLSGGAATLAASHVEVISSSRLRAVFNLSSATAGDYDLAVTAGGVSATVDNALTITDSAIADFRAQILLPSRFGFQSPAFIRLEYENTGDVVIPAPLVKLSGHAQVQLTLAPSRVSRAVWAAYPSDDVKNEVEILASGDVPGLLYPGESKRVTVYYAGMSQPWPDIEHLSFVATSLHGDNREPIDWTSVAASVIDDFYPENLRESVALQLASQVGNTWGDYERALAEAAYHFHSLGVNVYDVTDLLRYLVRKASGFQRERILEEHLDLGFTGDAEILSLSRTYPYGGICGSLPRPERCPSGRSAEADFGLGWRHTFGSYIEFDESEIKLAIGGEPIRRFYRDRRTYLNGTGYRDDGHEWVFLADDGYRYRTSDGEEFVFEPVTGATGLARLARYTDIRGRTLDATYSAGRLATLSAMTGEGVTFTRGALGLVTRAESNDGRSVNYTYDVSGRLIQVTDTDGDITTYEYGSGLLDNTLARVARGAVELGFEYDELGRIIDAAFPGTDVDWQLEYDDNSGVTLTLAEDLVITETLDNEAFARRTSENGQEREQTTWDPGQESWRTVRADGYRSYAKYDTFGNLLRYTNALGERTRLWYRNRRDLGAFYDARDHVTSFAHDDKGNVTAVWFADSTRMAFRYDELGHQTERRNARGATTTYAYENGRLASIGDEAGDVSLAYDSHGYLNRVVLPSGTISYTHTLSGDVSEVDFPNSRSVRLTHTAFGRIESLRDQANVGVSYVHDAAGQITTVTHSGGAVLVRKTHDSQGRLRQRALGNGVVTDFGYEGRNLHLVRTVDARGLELSRFQYAYDRVGRVTSILTHLGQWLYDYDLAGRLTGATFESGDGSLSDRAWSYRYDAVGNRTETTTDGVLQRYESNEVNQYTSSTTGEFVYDLDGNLSAWQNEGGSYEFEYDASNHLVGWSGSDGTEVERTLDLVGLVLERTKNGVATHRNVAKLRFGETLGEYTAAGTPIRRCYDADGLAVCELGDGEFLYYTFDGSGNTSEITDAEGRVVNRYQYDAFGTATLREETRANPYTYGGQFQVEEEAAGLYCMRARCYLSELGRFLQRDPAGVYSGEPNAYVYAANRPVDFHDPLGRWAVEAIAAATGAGGGVQDGGGWSGAGRGAIEGIAGSWIPAAAGSLGAALFLPTQNPDMLCNFANGVHAARNPTAHIESQLNRAMGGNGGGYDSPCRPGRRRPPADPDRPDDPGDPEDDEDSNLGTPDDPNEKIGVTGVGPENYIRPGAPIVYTVRFENNPTAETPAQQVDVVDPLSESLDWATFEVLGAGFGDQFMALDTPGSRLDRTLSLDTQDDAFDVEVHLSIDASGLVTGQFLSIDPEWDVPPAVDLGFLPPEDGTGRGQGFVTFSVDSRADLASGTQIRNVAEIRFDRLASIFTNQVDPHDASMGTNPEKESLATIDADPPLSTITAEGSEGTQSLSLAWSAMDSHSGVEEVEIYARAMGESWHLLTTGVAANTTNFECMQGQQYEFYSVATDRVGNIEPHPLAPQAVATCGVEGSTPVEPDVRAKDGGCSCRVVVAQRKNVYWYLSALMLCGAVIGRRNRKIRNPKG